MSVALDRVRAPRVRPLPRDFICRRFHSPRSAARGSGGRAPPASSTLLGDWAGPWAAAATQSSSGLRRRRSAPRLASRCLGWWPVVVRDMPSLIQRDWTAPARSHFTVALPFRESFVVNSRLRLRRSRTGLSSWRRRVENSVRYHRDLERRDEIARGRRHLRRASPHVHGTTTHCSLLPASIECALHYPGCRVLEHVVTCAPPSRYLISDATPSTIDNFGFAQLTFKYV